MARSTQVNISTGGMGLDTTDFARFAKALRKAEVELSAQLKVELRAAGAIVAELAKAKAPATDEDIAGSIKVRVSGVTVSVVAGGKGLSLASAIEISNVGSSSSSKFFHPVFGHWVKGKGASQALHPYLFPALEEGSADAEADVVDALDRAIAIAIAE